LIWRNTAIVRTSATLEVAAIPGQEINSGHRGGSRLGGNKRNGADSIASSSPLGYESRPEGFVSSLETVLLSYLQEDNLSIELAAELCGTSKRSLQRKLKEMGTNYREVLGRTRFRAACEMLQNQNMAVADIALHLEYSDGSHFGRAFRRIAGVSPCVYRRQFIH
jgi:AraC-like DNA-binding protein